MTGTIRGNETANILGIFEVVTGRIPSSLELEIMARGADVLSTDRVKRYQKSQVQDFRAKAGWWGKHVCLAWLLGYLNILAFLSSILGLIFGWFFVGVQTIWLLVPVVVSAFAVNFFTAGTKMGNAMAHWESTDLSQYYRGIPTQMMLLITAVSAIPGTTVVIEHFKDDPFVFLQTAEERYCFGYWDAPGFEKFV